MIQRRWKIMTAQNWNTILRFVLFPAGAVTYSTDRYSDMASHLSLSLSISLFSSIQEPALSLPQDILRRIRLAKKNSRRWQGNANRIFLHSVWSSQYVISTPLLTALVWSVDGGLSPPSLDRPLFSPSLLVSVCVLFQHQIIIGHLMERKRDTDRTGPDGAGGELSRNGRLNRTATRREMPTAHPLTPFGKPPRNQNKLFWSDAALLGCLTGDRGKLGESIATFCYPTESWNWGDEKENNLSRKVDAAWLILKKWQHACLNQTRLNMCRMKDAPLTLCRQKFKYVTCREWVSTSQKTQSITLERSYGEYRTWK